MFWWYENKVCSGDLEHVFKTFVRQRIVLGQNLPIAATLMTAPRPGNVKLAPVLTYRTVFGIFSKLYKI